MGPQEFTLIAAMAGLLVLSALCSGSETAMFRLRHADRVEISRRNPRAAARVEELLSKPRSLLITVLLLNMVVNVVYFALASVLAMRVEGALAQTIAGIAPLLALILVGEVFAKLIAGAERVRVAPAISGPLLVLRRLVTPARVLVDGLAITPITRLVTSPNAGSSAVGSRELRELVSHAAEAGDIDRDEQYLLRELVALGDRRIRELMTPRQQIDWLPEGFSSRELLELVERTGHAKFPVCRDSLDGEVLGLVDARAHLAASALRDAGARDVAIPPLERARFASEASRIDQLLDLFRATGTHIAMCVDEHGSIRGIISIRAIVDSLDVPGIVGGPSSGLEEQVQMVGLGEWLVPGGLSVGSWSEIFGVDPVRSGPATIGGLVASELGRIPQVGDMVVVQRLEIEVVEIDRRAVRTARVRLLTGTQPGEAAS